MRVSAFALALVVCFVAAPAVAESELEGRITIRSPVVGATVLVDDQPVGVVPLAPFDLRFGGHIITVKKEGLISFEKQIRLRTGEHLVIDAVPAEARSLLTIDAGGMTGGQVRLDGQPLGPLPVEQRSIAPGRHHLEIHTPGHEPVQLGFVAPPHEEYVVRPAFVSAMAQVADDHLELELPGEPATAATTEVALQDEEVPARPAPHPLAVREAPVPMATFLADPIAHEEVRRARSSTPIYKKAWFWAATGAVAVAAVAVPVLAGGSYQEVRDPSAACADCLAVLNP